MNSMIRIAVPALLTLVGSLAGCAGGSGGGGGAAKQEENAFVHQADPEAAARLKDTNAVKSNNIRLYVNGMGCPQCVSNIDLQLGKLRGVKSSRVNLSNGTVDVELYSKDHPSPAQISRAVSGDFTLMKIEELGAGELK